MSQGSGGVSATGNAQYFSLRWNNHPSNLVTVFSGLYSTETLVDVTLAAEGKQIQAHKMLLSACSDYFQTLFSVNPCRHPIVILKDVPFEDLETVLQFMYNGVVNVSAEKLPAVLRTANTLQIKGLGEKFSESVNHLMNRSYENPRLLSVPSQHSVNSRQLSTESLPEYLHRTRDYSPRRQASSDSRQYSTESTVSTHIRKQPTPPASPPRHLRKKFRRISGTAAVSSGGRSNSGQQRSFSSLSDRGNSLEELDHARHSSPTPASTMSVAATAGSASASARATLTASPPSIQLMSPSRQSSSSTDHGEPSTSSNTGTIVAKKKRELFSARSSRSGGSNKSSCSEYSREHSFKLESSGSSGQSHSISQSQDDPSAQASMSAIATPSSSSAAAVAMVYTSPISGSATTVIAGTSSATQTNSSTSTSTTSRTLTRAQSAGESTSTLPPKRTRTGRFLKRQDCLEKGMDLTTDAGSPPDIELGLPPPTIKSSPNSPLMGAYPMIGSPPEPKASDYSSPYSSSSTGAISGVIGAGVGAGGLPSLLNTAPNVSSPMPSSISTIASGSAGVGGSSSSMSMLAKQKSQSLFSSEHTHHLSLSAKPPPPWTSPHHYSEPSNPPLPPPPPHKLPSVRVIPDASVDPLTLDRPPVPNVRLLCPPDYSEQRRLPLMKSRSTDSPTGGIPGSGSPGPSPYISERTRGPVSVIPTTSASANPYEPLFGEHDIIPSSGNHHQQHQHQHQLPPTGLGSGGGSAGGSDSSSHHLHSVSSAPPPPPPPHPPASIPPPTSVPHPLPHQHQPPHQQQPPPSQQPHHPPDQFGHCPKAREGPALGCNYCWNTTDANGRILRRKTKYHCPDCQANLCIVPCFQQYHEALEREKGMSPH